MLSPAIAHWSVFIDNICYSLGTDNGNYDGKIIIKKT